MYYAAEFDGDELVALARHDLQEGRRLDMQIGFGTAGVLDPLTQNNEALLGTPSTFCEALYYHIGQRSARHAT